MELRLTTVETKTDNHYTADKVALRVELVLATGLKEVKVLDAYGGHGVVWRAASKKLKEQGVSVHRVAIDERDDLKNFHLHGDNTKVMRGMDLNRFDVIDLDAYGYPFEQLKVVFDSRFSGVVFVTAITVSMGIMHKDLLMQQGFTETMIDKAPTLCAKRGWDIFLSWLQKNGVKKIVHRGKARKHYLGFVLNDAVQLVKGCDTLEANTAVDRL
jgi:hypothetical protein